MKAFATGKAPGAPEALERLERLEEPEGLVP